MKITLTNGKEFDTSDLNIAEEEVFIKQHYLIKLAEKYDIPVFSMMFGNNILWGQHFASKDKTTNEQSNERKNRFVEHLNSYVYNITGGEFKIVRNIK